ncbi:hypothetical protein B9Z55_016162 [Caenorhabditis nigoni]|uniref:Uncharacterized protein n=1 Tax=Caenorhabditis nigoni TaxID=1611254 RepID=A0A2G5UDJ0_9PELO|nr:hypothetical protein B9Z55_016162 [Caenorhabditis nigoni]
MEPSTSEFAVDVSFVKTVFEDSRTVSQFILVPVKDMEKMSTDKITLESSQMRTTLDWMILGGPIFLRIYDKAKKSKTIKSTESRKPARSKYRSLIFSCGSLSEDGLVLFTFNIAPYQGNLNYRDLLVLALPDEKIAEKLSEELNSKFARFAEQQLQTASILSTSKLDTPLTESSHQSSVVSKAINEWSTFCYLLQKSRYTGQSCQEVKFLNSEVGSRKSEVKFRTRKSEVGSRK